MQQEGTKAFWRGTTQAGSHRHHQQRRQERPQEARTLFQVFILENKLALDPLAPPVLLTAVGGLGLEVVVKVDVGALFKFVRRNLGLLVSLEPGQVFLVEPPRLAFQLVGRQVLLVGALLVVKDEEEGVEVKLFKQGRLVERGRGH